jgi:hypothetical protein
MEKADPHVARKLFSRGDIVVVALAISTLNSQSLSLKMRSAIGANVRNRPYETARIARFPLYEPVHPHAFLSLGWQQLTTLQAKWF